MPIGLTFEEAEEFRKLDDSMPWEGEPVWPTTGLPLLASELRWLELWTRHEAALAEAGPEAGRCIEAA